MSIAQKIIDEYGTELSSVLSAVRHYEAQLGPSHTWVPRVRQTVWRACDPILRPLGRQTVRRRGRADYVATVHCAKKTIEQCLASNYHRNLLSTKKYRVVDGDRQWACGSWVHDTPDTEWQHHVYLFEHADGVDIYAHREASVRNPDAHHQGEQYNGVAGDVLLLADDSGIEYEQN